MDTSNTYAVIMAGGSGTRFWPASRRHLPKQFLRLAGRQTLLESTIDRLLPDIPPERIIVVGSAFHKELLTDLELNSGVRLLIEPLSRNTAACIGLAASYILSRDEDGLMVVLPADHFIGNEMQFRQTLQTTCDSAINGRICIIGVPPSRPETGYGYIEKGIPMGPNRFLVQRFVEKPSFGKAMQYLESGNYLWNCGIFVMSAQTAISELSLALPVTADIWGKIASHFHDGEVMENIIEIYNDMPSVSFDYAVMEKTRREVVVLESEFAWSDVGSWQSAYELSQNAMDSDGNVTEGDVVAIACNGCLIKGSQRVIAAIGLTDIMVIDTDDAVLVAPLSYSQNVKEIVEQLKARNLHHVL